MKFAVTPTGKGGKTTLATIRVVTTIGDEYVFPAMDRREIVKVLPKGSTTLPSETPTLGMVNVSYAVISIPFKIIAKIFIDEEEWWTA